jgi:hypothetical protein
MHTDNENTSALKNGYTSLGSPALEITIDI